MSQYYKLRSSSVIHELIDQEIILADLDTGVYFSIRESGIPVWQMLVAGKEVEAILQAVIEHHSTVDAVMIRQDILKFIQELANLQLIVASGDISDASVALQDIAWGQPYYHFPLFEQFNDMQQLLLLDPIHEVDEQGWPHQSVNAQ